MTRRPDVAIRSSPRVGSILVTRASDPGWTPIFINAAAVVLEVGGALQHGAVIAREYGLPCVSGLDGVTEVIEDGQMIEVDGSNGVVRVVAPQPELPAEFARQNTAGSNSQTGGSR